jgi:GntR family transcriptional regulator / MocR family aminotransferase
MQDLHISLIGRRDLSGEIYRQLREAILDGRLRAGERLLPTRELAGRLSVSRTTAAVGYDRLISEGFAHARVGSGTYVSPHLSASRLRPKGSRAALRPRAIWTGVPLPVHLWRETEFDFRAGIPDARLFPYQTWRGFMARELRPSAVGRGGYGHPAGHEGLRDALARHIGTARGVRAVADDIIVTNGTQQAMDLVARVLLAPGDAVAVEDPGYPPVRRLLATLGARVVGVPVDDEGLVVDAIPAGTKMVCVAPSHQFPLGTSMSLRRRVALLDWAERTDAAIVEDDYDSEFRYDGRPIEPLHALDSSGRVIYVGSFSKTMLATLRIGFVVVPPSLRDGIRAAKYLTDWHSPLPTQAALARFIADGWLARHVRRMRRVYQQRHERISEIVRTSLADQLEVIPSSVGLHLATRARERSADQVSDALRRASMAGVEALSLGQFAVAEEPRAGIVLGYGAIGVEQIEAGLVRLADCLRR